MPRPFTPEREQTLFHPSELELGETTTLILDQITKANPIGVVFDSLSEMRLLAQNPVTLLSIFVA